MLKKKISAAISIIVFFMANATAQSVRDYIHIVGAFTGVPLATAVADHFTKASTFKSPKIEANTTGGGLKAFCAGIGVEIPDATTATRRIRATELELCEKNGVKEVLEVKLGYDALVLAHASKNIMNNLNRKELFLAIAKEVPDPKGGPKLVQNPYKTWKEINAAWPAINIQITGPAPTIGSYDALVNYIMVAGCKQFSTISALESSDPQAFEAACKSFRKDGAYTEFSNYDVVLQELKNNSDLLGIIGFSMSRRGGLSNSALDNSEPTLVNISRQMYVLTFPLYLYVKKAHIGLVPGIQEYLDEFTSEKAMSVSGYLFNEGVVPMPLPERQKIRADIKAQKPMSLKP